MPLVLTAAHHTQAGLREHNDDVVGMVMPSEPQMSAKGMIAVIADGVSGNAGGREAAEYSVHGLLADYYATPDSWPIPQALDRVIRNINRAVQKQGMASAATSGMATTLTALVVRGSAYYFAHVGDTRLYLLRDDTLIRLSTDHVLDQPGMRHVLTRAIGLDAELAIDQGSGELRAGDIFLLASDGVWGQLPEDELSWHLATLADTPGQPGATAKLLVDAALATGSKDNASAIVMHIAQLPDEHARDPLALWKIVGAIALVANLLLYLLLAG